MKADLALINGKVVTVDSEGSLAEAVAIKGDRLLRVGSTAPRSIPPATGRASNTVTP